ncbi:cytoplasmic protein [uncultured Desulfobacter sp.]|uniref:cytoplasmic protein n=1 Tax=uncultured Desulfobacter sp. TaxID=240139 RepID=UPI002AA7F9D3|nr:cytoplasmic protein [uncultured Desulfobacter sp.]
MKKKDTHQFIQEYRGLAAFGMDRTTDEETIMFYLQKFSEDTFMKALLPRLSERELEDIYNWINTYLKNHISEDEYHSLFLKDR